MKRVAIIFVSLAALSACNSSKATDVPESSSSTPTSPNTEAAAPATPASSPEEPTREQMAGQYTSIVDELIPLVDKLNALSASASVAEFNRVCSDLSTAAFDAMSKATADRWSEAVQPLIADWVKAVSEMRNYFEACNVATSDSDVADALNPLQTSNAHDESSLIRIALGLPEN